MGLKVNTIESVSGGPVLAPDFNITSGLSIPSWNVNVDYKIGNIVRRNTTLYLVTADHTSQAVSNNFYTDWITNGYLTPMSSAPGDIVYKVGASNAGLLPLDGSDQLIASYPDLNNYLYGFTNPINLVFSQSAVSNNGGYSYFNIPAHGFISGDMVYITVGNTGSPTFTFSNKPYFVQVVDANNFYISTENWAWTTNSVATNRLTYSAGLFGNNTTNNNIIKTFWGRSLTPLTHFKLPDFRGITTRNSGTNGYMVKYDRSDYSKIAGSYFADAGLAHNHNVSSATAGALCVNGVDYNRADNTYPTTTMPNQARASDTEFAPAHVVVNAYIRF